jgi:hypothetical protein
MKTQLLITGFILMLLIGNCKKENENPKVIESFSISYKRSSAWVDYSYSAIVDHTGLLQITEKSGLSLVNRKSAYHLDNSDIQLIKDKLSSLINIDVKDSYGFGNKNAPTDLPVTRLIYHTTYKSDSTTLYFPGENEMPLQFESFFSTISQVITKNDTVKK